MELCSVCVCIAQVLSESVVVDKSKSCGQRWLMDEVEHCLLTQHLHVSQNHPSYRMPICYLRRTHARTHKHRAGRFLKIFLYIIFPLSSRDLHQFPPLHPETVLHGAFFTIHAFQHKRICVAISKGHLLLISFHQSFTKP